MSKTKELRRELIRIGDSTLGHSMNQRDLNIHLWRVGQGQESRKAVRAKSRENRFLENAIAHEEAKTQRIEARVRAVIYGGYDGTNPEVLTAELKFLARRGVLFKGFTPGNL